MTVNRLLDDLGEGEFQAWQQYWLIEPFGCEWWQHAELCATIANYAGRVLPDKKHLSVWDFMPTKQPKAQGPTTTEQVDRMEAAFRAVVIACGQKIVQQE
jgi:hypothetical protein